MQSTRLLALSTVMWGAVCSKLPAGLKRLIRPVFMYDRQATCRAPIKTCDKEHFFELLHLKKPSPSSICAVIGSEQGAVRACWSLRPQQTGTVICSLAPPDKSRSLPKSSLFWQDRAHSSASGPIPAHGRSALLQQARRSRPGEAHEAGQPKHRVQVRLQPHLGVRICRTRDCQLPGRSATRV